VYKSFGKRFFDFIASLIGLIVLSPFLFIIAIWIKLSSKGPIFYVQKRVGKNFKEFNLYKFRSMIIDADKKGLLVTSGDDPRVTKVGRFIRKYKIDELPQLFNVLKGDMSLVGPRPEVKKYVDLKRDDYKKILSIKPGITDNAAIEFVNEEDLLKQFEDKEKAYLKEILPKKIELYKQYINNISFKNDIKLILDTVGIAQLKYILKPTHLKRKIFFILSDAIFTPLTLYFAFLLRFNFEPPQDHLNSFWFVVSLLLIFKVSIFHYFKLYKVSWRFFSLQDEKKLLIGHIIAYVLVYLVYFIKPEWFNPFPRSVLLIDLFLSIVFLTLLRFLKRAILENSKNREQPAIIFGASTQAYNTIRSFLHNEINIYPIAIIDDEKKGTFILNVDVFGSDNLENIVKKHNIKTAVIAKDMSRKELRVLSEKLSKIGVYNIKIAQYFKDESGLKDISIEDLLAREPKDLDTKVIANFIKDKKVLVTGGGGSIGSEIVRQCSKFGAKELIVVEASEYNLYKIAEEVNIEPCLMSIVDREKLFKLFKDKKPDIIIHAAAYKHVPLCEKNIEAAIENNIIGTMNVVDASIETEVKKLVIISTDKAVRPTNVMGATKRVTELYEGNVDSKNTEIVAVRFGNVLGSSGSVIPKFKEQIEKGGPVTVTHPDITRYFMLIPEACQLVLQAAAIAKGGELFILDMGEPVKIAGLAKTMIRLYGKEGEIEIVYTGLRAGEKLYEELLINDSEQKTKYSSILVAKRTKYPIEKLRVDIQNLLEAKDKIAALQKIVPEFEHKA